MYKSQATVTDSPILQIKILWTIEDIITNVSTELEYGQTKLTVTKNSIPDNYDLILISRDFEGVYYKRNIRIRYQTTERLYYHISTETNDSAQFTVIPDEAFTVAEVHKQGDLYFTIVDDHNTFIILDWNALVDKASYDIWCFNVTFPRNQQSLYTAIRCQVKTNSSTEPTYTTITLNGSHSLQTSDDILFSIVDNNLQVTYIYKDNNQTQNQVPKYIKVINGVTIDSPHLTLMTNYSRNTSTEVDSSDKLPEHPVFANLFNLQ